MSQQDFNEMADKALSVAVLIVWGSVWVMIFEGVVK